MNIVKLINKAAGYTEYLATDRPLSFFNDDHIAEFIAEDLDNSVAYALEYELNSLVKD